jgi:GntR family transcriptional repressor for pyruvate dehydrogenase complex
MIDPMRATAPVFHTARGARTFEDVALQVKSAILDGHFKPGDRLPPQRDLHKQFKVSRFAVTQALHILETTGLVDIRPGAGGGAFVRRPDINTINSSIDLIASMHGVTFEELAEFREAIEGRNAYWAAQRSTSAELSALGALVHEITQVCADQSVPWALAVARDAAFHGKVAELSKNRLSAAVLQGVVSGLRAGLQRVPETYRARMARELAAIYEAIRARRATDAETLMRNHIAGFRRIVVRAQGLTHAGVRRGRARQPAGGAHRGD